LLAEARAALRPDSSAVMRASLELSEGRFALAHGDAADAVRWTRRALDSFAAASPSQPSLVATQTFLARCLNVAGQFPEALVYSQRSLKTATDRLGDLQHSSAIGTAQLEAAIAHQGLGEVEAARTAVAQALEHLVATVGPDGPSTRRAERLQVAGSRRQP
jgi:tetratricopeptide (TPR) repeat protein